MDKIDLLNIPGVVSFGDGTKYVRGRDTGAKCIQVHVQSKKPVNKISQGESIPSEINGVKTDVIAVGNPVAFAGEELRSGGVASSPVATLYPGCSLSRNSSTIPGTAGAIVLDTSDNSLCILACYHTIVGAYNETPASVGTEVWYPAKSWSGIPSGSAIGQIKDYIKIPGKTGNTVDAALISIYKRGSEAGAVNVATRSYWHGITPREVLPVIPAVNMQVTGSGRSTDQIVGRILATNVTVQVQIETSPGVFQAWTFNNQIMLNKCAEEGDSGAVLYRGDYTNPMNPVGMVFAGSSAPGVGDAYTPVTYANPMSTILESFGSSTLVAGGALRPTAGVLRFPTEEEAQAIMLSGGGLLNGKIVLKV